MANTKVNPSNGIWSLGGTRDTDISGISADQYEVYTADDKLANAKADFPDYDWFTAFSVNVKGGGSASVTYTLTFNKPASGNLYYYLNKKVYPVQYSAAPNKGSQARVQASLKVGDPPIGMK